MLGKYLKHMRERKKLTRKDLAKALKIDSGYITHIEKAERTPSFKLLLDLCDYLDIPYENVFSIFGKKLTKDQEKYNYLKYKADNRVLLIDDINDIHYMERPSGLNSVSFGLLITDDSMDASFDKDTYVFVDIGAPIDFDDIGLFYFNGKILIRRLFLYHGKYLFLHADNPKYESIKITDKDKFYIIGKIIQ